MSGGNTIYIYHLTIYNTNQFRYTLMILTNNFYLTINTQKRLSLVTEITAIQSDAFNINYFT